MCAASPETFLTITDPSELDYLHRIAICLHQSLDKVSTDYAQLHQNVRQVLQRQWAPEKSDDIPTIEILAEAEFLQTLKLLSDIYRALMTLARMYDAIYLAVCRNRDAARRGRPHVEELVEKPVVNVETLTNGLLADTARANDRIVVKTEQKSFVVQWEPVVELDLSSLPVLESLEGLLPGEQPLPSNGPAKRNYVGIAGGGGSDIISASVLGHLLRGVGKEMDLLISTRTWLTGSQGKPGSKIGEKREVFDHGGPATDANREPVPGTYRITAATHTSGRELETIPLSHYQSIFLTLDPGSTSPGDDAPLPSSSSPAPLVDQYRAIISSQPSPIHTILSVDTGGDVLSPDPNSQDFRVQRTLASLSCLDPAHSSPSLTTAIFAPGIDSPAPSSPSSSSFNTTSLLSSLPSAHLYRPTPTQLAQMLHLLADEYHMDGRDPARFGKTTLCLQHALRGRFGWQVLALPRHVVLTGSNPWSVFEWVGRRMGDVVFVGTGELVRGLEGQIELNSNSTEGGKGKGEGEGERR